MQGSPGMAPRRVAADAARSMTRVTVGVVSWMAPIAATAVLLASALVLAGDARADRSSPATAPDPADEPVNVLLVTLDTTRADRLGCYGADVETPHLDALAARGTRFLRTTASAPVTLPSHASIFTGLDPNRHGVRENGTFVLAERHVTLAEWLSARGHRTAAFVGGFPVSARFGLGQGFDHYDDALSEDNATPPSTELWQGVERPHTERRGEHVVRRAARWIESVAGEPFFVWVHLFDPHSPYAPPEPFATRYADRLYEGEIAYVDAMLGRLFEGLDRQGLRDRTLIVVAADHGESLGEHGIRGHGRYLYEPSLHVPLIFAWPGRVASGRVVPTFVRNVDIAPSVLALLGEPVPGGLDGRSLLPWLAPAAGPGAATMPASQPPEAASQQPDPADAYAETLMPQLRFRGPTRLALIREPWKLVREIGRKTGRIRERLFHLRDDPGEADDRSADAPAVRAALAAALDARAARAEATRAPLELDAETESMLRALGYLP